MVEGQQNVPKNSCCPRMIQESIDKVPNHSVAVASVAKRSRGERSIDKSYQSYPFHPTAVGTPQYNIPTILGKK